MSEKQQENSFDLADYLTAREVFAAWQATQAQELDDWLMRQRKAELNALVRKVIKNEFSAEDRHIISLRWYKNMSAAEIAKELSLSRAAVYRRLDKIDDTLFDKLKYALEYRFGIKNERPALLVEAYVKDDSGTPCISSAQRLRRLRLSQHITPESAAEKCAIRQGRLEAIESGKSDPTATELKRLAQFYKVSSDFILFGKKRILRDPQSGLPVCCNC